MELFKGNSWTLNLAKLPKYAEWKGEWHYEIDRQMIQLILECTETDEFGNRKITDTMKAHFKNNIVDRMRGNTLHIQWRAPKDLGRRYSSNDLDKSSKGFCASGNLGVHSKYIKNTIYQQANWVDYDMVKGHPTLLVCVGNQLNITDGLPAIQRYIDNFDAIAEEMIAYHSCIGETDEETQLFRLTKGDIKELHNLTIYGGGKNTWITQIETGDEKKGKIPKPVANKAKMHPKYEEFKTEIRRVADLVYDSNPELVKLVCTVEEGHEELPIHKKKSRTMSYFCGILENECLRHAYNYGVKAGLFEAKRIDLCMDGFTAPRPSAETDMDFHVAEMNKYIFEKTRLRITMKVKPFIPTNPADKCYVIQSIIDARNAMGDETPSPVSDKNEQYLKWKEAFEKEWCKIKNTACFIRKYTEDGQFSKYVVLCEQKLITAYKHEKYTEVDAKGKKVVRSYITEWINDENILCYDDANVFPPPLVCPPNVFNLWIPSPYESQPITEEDAEFDREAVEMFRKHLDIMCGGRAEQTSWLTSWIAHLLQNPSKKPEHAINLVGLQGAGKSFITDVITLLLAKGQALETTAPENDVWGKFNSLMMSAIFVVLSETDKRNEVSADGKIKALITDKTIIINGKGKDAFGIKSYHRFVKCTNTMDPTKTSAEDRRNWILRCSDELKGNIAYFSKLGKAIERPNALRSIYWWFKKFDISEWNFRLVPKTDYHEKIVEHNRNPFSIFMEYFVYKHLELDPAELTCQKNGVELLEDFREWSRSTGYKFEELNAGVLLKKLKLECGLPADSIMSGNRTKHGFTQTINLQMLKRHFNIGCLVLSESDGQLDAEPSKGEV